MIAATTIKIATIAIASACIVVACSGENQTNTPSFHRAPPIMLCPAKIRLGFKNRSTYYRGVKDICDVQVL